MPGLGDDMYAERDISTDRDYAVFGELAVDLVKNLTLTLGDREFWYDNNGFGFNGYAGAVDRPTCVPAPTFDPPIPCADTDTKSVGNGNTHKFTLSWKIDPDHMVYATESTGFRPGGPNNRVGVAATGPTP